MGWWKWDSTQPSAFSPRTVWADEYGIVGMVAVHDDRGAPSFAFFAKGGNCNHAHYAVALQFEKPSGLSADG
jgi:hypothetical protein